MDITLLDVPHIWQEGRGAGQFRNDCGPTCAAAVIRAYTGTDVFPDTLFSSITGIDRYITMSELVILLRNYGVPSEWRTFDVSNLLIVLNEHKPVIALIKYGVLKAHGYGAPGVNFTGPHWVVVIGIDLDYVVIRDPLMPGDLPTRVKLDAWLEAWDDVGHDPLMSNPSFGGIVPLAGIGAPPSTKRVKVVCNTLNIRSGPGGQYKIVGALIQGNIVDVLEETGDWFRHGDSRWSHSGYVRQL